MKRYLLMIMLVLSKSSFAGIGSTVFTLESASSTVKPYVVNCKVSKSCENTLMESVAITTDIVEVNGAKLGLMMNAWGLGGRSETTFSKPENSALGMFYLTGSQFNDVKLTPNNLKEAVAVVISDEDYLPADRESYRTYWLVTNTPVLAGLIFTDPHDKRNEVSVPKGVCVNIKAESTRMISIFKYCNKESGLVKIQHIKDIEDSVLKAGITPGFLGFKK